MWNDFRPDPISIEFVATFSGKIVAALNCVFSQPAWPASWLMHTACDASVWLLMALVNWVQEKSDINTIKCSLHQKAKQRQRVSADPPILIALGLRLFFAREKLMGKRSRTSVAHGCADGWCELAMIRRPKRDHRRLCRGGGSTWSAAADALVGSRRRRMSRMVTQLSLAEKQAADLTWRQGAQEVAIRTCWRTAKMMLAKKKTK